MLWICKIYFLFVLFVFIRFEFEENNKYDKKVLSQQKNSLTLQLSLRYVRNMTRSCLLCNSRLFRKERLFLVLRVFCVILDNPRPTLNSAICGVYSLNIVET